MADIEWLAAVFEEHRDHLRAVAYRLLGSATDADDAVQDTWLRLTGADTTDVANLRGWLTTVVARVSLNMLRSRRREQPVGDSWSGAEELAASRPGTTAGPHVAGAAPPAASPEDEAVLADSVGLALLVVLDTLTPSERLAFVLHDMFAMPFDEISGVLGRTPEATRQLASRARRRVRGASNPDHGADVSRQREVATAFIAAARGGDLSALVALLDPDVTLHADAGASPSGRAVERQGVRMVAAGAVASSARATHSQLALIDGTVGIVFAPAGRLQVVVKLTVNADSKITAMDIIADQERLRRVQIAVLPASRYPAGYW